ncbi:LysE family translocator [Lacibacterium aquatile]|uniref:LysE family translocator n=1 Tax=Lacibacterium aquatile TaxID=1168082 RepID=A0ABW5DVL5_9PROT
MLELALVIVPFAFSMTASPGPANLMVAATATNFGIARIVPQILGIAVALFAMILAAGFGLGEILLRLPQIHGALKYAGAAYLLYLGYRIATAAPPRINADRKPVSFLGAVMLQVLNPKGWIIALGAVTAFTRPTEEMSGQVLVIAGVTGLIALPSMAIWGLLGEAAGRLLQSARAFRVFNLTMAGLLVASIVTLFT